MTQQEQDRSSQHQNPEVPKNYRPETAPPTEQPGRGVDGNYTPTTDTAPSSPPPKPRR